MCWMAAIPVAISLVSGMMGAQNAKQQGAFQEAMAEQNAAYKEAAARDAEKRGAVDADRYRRNVGQLIGTQRAGFAANGIDVNSGTAAEIQDDTAEIGEFDALTIANNAAREAWGYRVGADNDRMNAKMSKSNARSAATGSILGGVGSAFGSFAGGR
ncbi:virion core protein, T7 gp14 family [Stutzerimonas nitrititolerans]|uniref:virion core protein, T7 gp14 family n=1 Tax=Stutzerimonas nitrititolerans TaxID=2482751 RepID=UPI0028AE10B0|nr:hypothetical protein [Stutzerimonas nitrititolerans]